MSLTSDLASIQSKRGRPRNSNAKATRERLMRAAAEQFSTAEFSVVSMEAIAAEAGLTGAAIYNHFASKDDLFVATAAHLTRVNLVAIKGAIEKEDQWKGKLNAVLRLFAEDTTGWFRYPLLTSAVQLKMLQNREQFSEMLALRSEYRTQFEEIVGCAIAEGDLPHDISGPTAAELLMGFVFNGMGTVMSHRKDEEEIRGVIETAALVLGMRSRVPRKLGEG